MSQLRSLTGVIMPDGSIKFHLSFIEKEPKENELQRISGIIDNAQDLSPEMQEIMVEFAEYLQRRYGRKEEQ